LKEPWAALYAREPTLLAHVHNPALDSLDLSGCELSTLPRAITRLSTLRTLDVSDNRFVTLPRELADLPALETLKVAGNPLAPHLGKILERVRACRLPLAHAASPLRIRQTA
jgi:Leucine rich repeat